MGFGISLRTVAKLEISFESNKLLRKKMEKKKFSKANKSKKEANNSFFYLFGVVKGNCLNGG